ncbi:MAG: ribonuclease III [Betaproteobacteria bacterium]|nr:ribonuclease III [Betaproteobacteria bacterium]NBY04675.1 ribonuclease III [Betaproteobacteria bacterium]
MSEPTATRSDLVALQQRLQHTFNNLALLQQALTHRSHSAEHNERLEFLGDSVLNLAVADLLYQRMSQVPEGELSRMRSNLVRQESLHEQALQLGLPGLIRLGEGELRSGGTKRPSILADALEALIGAIYLDAGHGPAHRLVHRLFDSVELHPHMQTVAKDAKTELQEWLQGRKYKLPIYRVVGTSGAAHQQIFEVECEIPELGRYERGLGSSRRAAEQAAAAMVLQSFKESPP